MTEAEVGLAHLPRHELQKAQVVASIACSAAQHSRRLNVQAVQEAMLSTAVLNNGGLVRQVVGQPLLERPAAGWLARRVGPTSPPRYGAKALRPPPLSNREASRERRAGAGAAPRRAR
eukprot:CAMPEP_0171279758 /NCGR_PEP_ID=MMETSP0790-20130122/65551_1 /TAXON_ID=2925 /ORGANISM="Alexandrium catenella, Strain OF101" /LENGTH=117 /DNA_ID=CAMNT_0011748959 /DNA_START=181 /DNA_END=532 /DNA_ORIENTATION=+